MKTLYVRIVITFVIIALVSGIIAFLLSNLYYHVKLKEYNEEKIMEIAHEIVFLHDHSVNMSTNEFMTSVANMNFQLYLVDSNLRGENFGDRFRNYDVDKSAIQSVLSGHTYEGISEFQSNLFVTGFFKDDVKNSIGVPININGENYALFIRPNVEKQFGEMRIVFSLLLGLTFLLSLMFILLCTTFLVYPIKKLTKATSEIAGGNYHLKLETKRQDEIGILTRDFNQMSKSLQKLDEMRQEFVSNVSHEIQSPLTSIQGFVKAIRTGIVSEQEADRYLEIIEKESSRLSSLSKQLLMLSSLDKQLKAIEKTSFRLDEQIREAILLTEWQWSEKNIEIELDLQEITIEADKQLLFQVWINLITNSIKFNKQNGFIHIEAAAGERIVVMIKDSGVGISESELPYIFDRFYMADQSRNREKSGSGLGLSIVKKIIEIHKGMIHVKSEFGKGTEMTIELPFKD